MKSKLLNHVEQSALEVWWPDKNIQFFTTSHPGLDAAIAEDTRERHWRLIQGYRDAADVLVDLCAVEFWRRPNLVYPIVFCYRHSLELMLKYFLEEYGAYAKEDPEFKLHSLQTIWPKCRSILQHFNPGGDCSVLDKVEELIVEYSEIDPASFSFRYAKSTKGKQLGLKVHAVNLSQLKVTMAGVHELLECADSMIYEIVLGPDC